MVTEFYSKLFGNLGHPVIVCRTDSAYSLVFANTKAQILLNPTLQLPAQEITDTDDPPVLQQLLRFQSVDRLHDLLSVVESVGWVENYQASVLDFNNHLLPMRLSANLATVEDTRYIVLYLREVHKRSSDYTDTLRRAFHIAHHNDSVDDAVNAVLRLAGSYVNLSRIAVFEKTSVGTIRNTYEWCAEAIKPTAHSVKDLDQNKHEYHSIIAAGAFVCNDTREISSAYLQRTFSQQETKSIVLIPLHHLHKSLGYIRFDECSKLREWSSLEVELLGEIAEVIASLIVRRKAEERALRSRAILQTILDNIDSAIYVNDLETMELVFINKALADSLGKSPDELLGKICWQVLQNDQTAPCDWCPIDRLRQEPSGTSHVWEFQNTITGKWYLAKDDIIKWVDGRYVHFETATEFTHQKQYEQQLKLAATTDALTGIYNRDWGHHCMQNALQIPRHAREALSLCFIDIDCLKKTNDTYGHEVGDEMICRTVAAIQDATRKSDIFFRWGGDEFILLLQCSVDIAERVMNKIEAQLHRLNGNSDSPYKLSISYGIADLSQGELDTLEEIIHEADQKMYAQKMLKEKC